MSDNHNFDDDDDFFEDDYVPPMSRWKLLGAALAVVIVAGFGIGIWYAYDQGVKKGVKLAPPIIKADDTPVKEQPEDPGGMEIPHQDKEVFNVMKPEAEQPEKVEQLMAPPEQVVEEAPPVDIKEDPLPKKSSEPEKLISEQPVEAPKSTEEMLAAAKEAAKEAIEGPDKSADAANTQLSDAAAEEARKAEEAKAQAAAEAQAAEKAAAEAKAKADAEAAAKEAAEKEAAAKEAAAKAAQTVNASERAAEGEVAYRVQLGAFRSEDAARKAWSDLQKKHEELLRGEVYKIQSVDVTGKGKFHRLQAGAFKNRDGATALCGKLKAAKQDCLIAKN
ncbi:SPOR domain-containing protein [Sneathiella glossodoripedis]|uniref:SPOR domain-containing protein n=1 Tax=Sneathiella glossodoripedis TaxID=418853 RepID=UPI00046EFB4E|nr:SPOR domain-containing protein [Sneathiella glossodoripedis]